MLLPVTNHPFADEGTKAPVHPLDLRPGPTTHPLISGDRLATHRVVPSPEPTPTFARENDRSPCLPDGRASEHALECAVTSRLMRFSLIGARSRPHSQNIRAGGFDSEFLRALRYFVHSVLLK